MFILRPYFNLNNAMALVEETEEPEKTNFGARNRTNAHIMRTEGPRYVYVKEVL